MVLIVDPHAVPMPWICPGAVNEIAQFELEAEEMIEQNDRDVVGATLSEPDEETVVEAIEFGGYSSYADNIHAEIMNNGIGCLTAEELDFCITRLQNATDELPSSDRIASELIREWEKHTGEGYE